LLPESSIPGIAHAPPRKRPHGRFASRGGVGHQLVGAGFVAGTAADCVRDRRVLANRLGTLEALVFRPRVGELLVNTVLLVLFTLPLCVALGIALAWLTERSNLPGRRAWSLLATAPLAVPAFVHSYAWVSLVPSIHGLPAGVLVSVIAYFPFLYLPVAATLRRLDPAIEDVAESLGSSPGRCSSGWCCRSCAWPSAAARCWSACTCWPNTACTR
jgi:iron(III) transport system permease protein